MVLNDWLIINSELQGLGKEFVVVCFKVLSLNLHTDQLRETNI